MGNFRDNKGGGGRSSGGRSFGGGRPSFNNRSGDRPMMHKTICSKCGKECEVPFKPTGSKPVFCSECFRENGGPDTRRNEGRNFSRPNFDNRDNRNDNRERSTQAPQYKEQLDSLNFKLDKILKILTSVAPEAEVHVVEEKVEEVEKEKVVAPKKKKLPKKAVLTPEEPQE